MAKICSEAEICYDNETSFWNRTTSRKSLTGIESLAASAVQMSFELDSKVIVCFTRTGHSARLLARFRPRAHIFAVSYDEHTIRGLTVSNGIISLRVPSFQGGVETLVEYAIKSAIDMGYCKSGDQVIVLQGSMDDHKDSNIIRFYTAK